MSDPKKIDNEEKVRQAIEDWCDCPVQAQLRNLKLAVDSIELNQMYFEQKGNDRGVLRMQRCLEIVKCRMLELENG